ncbi:MAG: MarR family winged helix-turn-helix transcriptional regulator [Firmicutes bacterium]|nr:MarR family winged helix-turn-helix transcriptional regulator [Bacillota bacterium]MCL2255727.1 MarR family winged helix-turn-helix transcriptional regulator [Bacillota bacterium]
MDEKQLKEFTELINTCSKIFNSNVVGRFQDLVTRSNGLTKLELQALIALNHYGKTSLSMLASGLGMPNSNTTRLIKSLVEKGFCKKEKGAEKNTMSVTLTETGKELIEEHKKFELKNYLALYNEHIPQEKQDRMFAMYEELIELWSLIPKKQSTPS